ncbi:MAG TPA: peptide deformylase [Polyangiaceae bacterium]|nr:peptide deformylase [Polyangiaceae bacterium]
MTVLSIATIGNPVLREPARYVARDELAGAPIQHLIDDMIETMHSAAGAGIAANQVHRPVRICVIEISNNPRYPYKPNWPLTILVNPTLEWTTDETFMNFEGCLSVPNLRGQVPRSVGVRVRAWDRAGCDLDFVVAGLTAGTFQHEVDHLEGKLFVDRVVDTRSLCTWADFDRFHRDEFVGRARALVARFGS